MRVYVLLADGYEEIEAITVLDTLKRAKIEALSVSMTDKDIVVGRSKVKIKTDMMFTKEIFNGAGPEETSKNTSKEVPAESTEEGAKEGAEVKTEETTEEKPKPKTQAAANEDLEGIMVVIPGGLLAVNALFEHEELGDLLKEHNEKGGYIAAICAGPVVLGELGILEGRNANCHRGFEGELYGATIVNERVVVDKNIITSIGPGSSIEFSLALVEIIKGAKTAEIVANGMMMK